MTLTADPELDRRVASLHERLRVAREDAAAAHQRASDLVRKAKDEGHDPIAGSSDADKAAARDIAAAYKAADERTAEAEKIEAELHRVLDTATGSTGPATHGRAWATEAAEQLIDHSAPHKAALVTAPIEVPSLIEPGAVRLPENPARLVDVLVNRRPLEESVVFEFLRQSTRDNQAAPVADLDTKPTSTFTLTPVEDRAKVIAHLSEPVPLRYLMDSEDLVDFLEAELRNGVLDALELEVIDGDGTGEHFTGILNTVGTTTVLFDTDALTTARKARTALEVLHEQPTAWVLSPSDAETFDLAREETSGMYLGGSAGLANIFGDIPRVISTSVPQGTALLGDWSQTRLYVRETLMLRADGSGDLFDTNAFKLRAEGRYGFAVLRPQAFAVVDLGTDVS